MHWTVDTLKHNIPPPHRRLPLHTHSSPFVQIKIKPTKKKCTQKATEQRQSEQMTIRHFSTSFLCPPSLFHFFFLLLLCCAWLCVLWQTRYSITFSIGRETCVHRALSLSLSIAYLPFSLLFLFLFDLMSVKSMYLRTNKKANSEYWIAIDNTFNEQ